MVDEAARGFRAVDAFVVVVDVMNLERNLYLALQLIDAGLPVVIALSMLDVAERKGLKVYAELLSRKLEVPVVMTRAREGKGLDGLKAAVAAVCECGARSSKRMAWLEDDSPFREGLARLHAALVRDEPGSAGETPCVRALGLLADVSAAPSETVRAAVDAERHRLREQGIDPDSFEAESRYRYLKDLISHCTACTAASQGDLTRKLDAILTHRVFGLIIFFVLMALLFQSIFTFAQVPMDLLTWIIEQTGKAAVALLPENGFRSLLVDGVLAGVGSVIVFLPQIAILFFFISLLEDSGYMARAAYLMDRVMSVLGLQGRSFIPLLNSFACAVPGIMSTRIIPSRQSRISTILIAPLMSCSARLPVYTLLIAAVVPEHQVLPWVSLQGLTMLGLYLLGIVTAAAVALVLKYTLQRKESSYFVMEMPAYHRPSMKVVLREVGDRIKAFLRTAGSMILFCSVLLWFLASYPKSPPGTAPGERIHHSYAGLVGALIEPVLRPLGCSWEEGVALITSFAAREVFVSTLATVYNLQDEGGTGDSLVSILREKHAQGTFSVATGLSLLVFFVLACQCSSTLVTCRRETNSWRWTAVLFGYTLVLAYGAAFLTFRIATALAGS